MQENDVIESNQSALGWAELQLKLVMQNDKNA